MGAQDCKSAVSESSENDVFLSQKIVFILANSADPALAFHLGLHCKPKYLWTWIQNEKHWNDWRSEFHIQ